MTLSIGEWTLQIVLRRGKTLDQLADDIRARVDEETLSPLEGVKRIRALYENTPHLRRYLKGALDFIRHTEGD